MLRGTTTPTVPPADEYERPEELREVTLNRMQVRACGGACLSKAVVVDVLGLDA